MAPLHPPCDQKKISRENRTLVCLDEAAFYLLPSVGYTWAPRGQPPILSEVCSRDHLSAISAITPQGTLYLHLQEYPFNGMDVVHFLCHLLGQIPGKLLILWDRAPIHINQYVRQLLASDHNQDLWLETFPAYARLWCMNRLADGLSPSSLDFTPPPRPCRNRASPDESFD